MNLQIDWSFPCNDLSRLIFLGGSISKIDLNFVESTLMPHDTMYPKSFLEVTINTHFLGFNLTL